MIRNAATHVVAVRLHSPAARGKYDAARRVFAAAPTELKSLSHAAEDRRPRGRMRRMRRVVRHPFRSLPVVSLLLCVAVCLLWVRSYDQVDQLRYVKRDGLTMVRSSCGTLMFSHERWAWNWNWDEGWDVRAETGNAVSNFDRARAYCGRLDPFGPIWTAGNGTRRYRDDGVTDSVSMLIVPHWAPAALALVLPVGAVGFAYRRRRRADAHLCELCGYDLRATPERCPECGTAVSRQS
jgi:hypothetical protein